MDSDTGLMLIYCNTTDNYNKRILWFEVMIFVFRLILVI